MDKKFEAISPEQMRKMASSPTAQALMEMLQKNSGVDMGGAMDSAQKGDMEKLQETFRAFLTDPQAQKLLKQLREEQNG